MNVQLQNPSRATAEKDISATRQLFLRMAVRARAFCFNDTM